METRKSPIKNFVISLKLTHFLTKSSSYLLKIRSALENLIWTRPRENLILIIDLVQKDHKIFHKILTRNQKVLKNTHIENKIKEILLLIKVNSMTQAF